MLAISPSDPKDSIISDIKMWSLPHLLFQSEEFLDFKD